MNPKNLFWLIYDKYTLFYIYFLRGNSGVVNFRFHAFLTTDL